MLGRHVCRRSVTRQSVNTGTPLPSSRHALRLPCGGSLERLGLQLSRQGRAAEPPRAAVPVQRWLAEWASLRRTGASEHPSLRAAATGGTSRAACAPAARCALERASLVKSSSGCMRPCCATRRARAGVGAHARWPRALDCRPRALVHPRVIHAGAHGGLSGTDTNSGGSGHFECTRVCVRIK